MLYIPINLVDRGTGRTGILCEALQEGQHSGDLKLKILVAPPPLEDIFQTAKQYLLDSEEAWMPNGITRKFPRNNCNYSAGEDRFAVELPPALIHRIRGEFANKRFPQISGYFTQPPAVTLFIKLISSRLEPLEWLILGRDKNAAFNMARYNELIAATENLNLLIHQYTEGISIQRSDAKKKIPYHFTKTLTELVKAQRFIVEHKYFAANYSRLNALTQDQLQLLDHALNKAVGVMIGRPSTAAYTSITYDMWVNQCSEMVNGVFSDLIESSGTDSAAPASALDALATLWCNLHALEMIMKVEDLNVNQSDIPVSETASAQALNFVNQRNWESIGDAFGFGIDFKENNPLKLDPRSRKAWVSLLTRIPKNNYCIKEDIGYDSISQGR